MNLDESQKQKIAAWIEEGLKLSNIQSRIETEFGERLTYMELRFLVDDLKIMPKDPDPPAPAESKEDASLLADSESAADTLGEQAGGVSVTVDALARPGALVSGSVRFSDGQSATWYLDQDGRLGVVPEQQGYKPSADDVQEFQIQLQTELRKMGYG